MYDMQRKNQVPAGPSACLEVLISRVGIEHADHAQGDDV